MPEAMHANYKINVPDPLKSFKRTTAVGTPVEKIRLSRRGAEGVRPPLATQPRRAHGPNTIERRKSSGMLVA